MWQRCPPFRAQAQTISSFPPPLTAFPLLFPSASQNPPFLRPCALFPHPQTVDVPNWKCMRSSAEIKFRLRQESANLYLALAKPTYQGELPPQPLNPLPDPRPIAAALRGSLFEFTVLATAQNILSHRFPLLGLTLETGPNIEWRRDYAHNKTSPPQYFRRLNYKLRRRRRSQIHLGTQPSPTPCPPGPRPPIHWQIRIPQRNLRPTRILARTESFSIRHQLDQRSRSRFPRAFLDLALVPLCERYARTPAPPLSHFSLSTRLPLIRKPLRVLFPNTHLLGEAVALHALGTLSPASPKPKRGASAAPKSSKPNSRSRSNPTAPTSNSPLTIMSTPSISSSSITCSPANPPIWNPPSCAWPNISTGS